jgi:hypothetical protein
VLLGFLAGLARPREPDPWASVPAPVPPVADPVPSAPPPEHPTTDDPALAEDA